MAPELPQLLDDGKRGLQLIVPGELNVKLTFFEDFLFAPLSRLSITWKNNPGTLKKFMRIELTIGTGGVLSRFWEKYQQAQQP
jgi:hypothetical protein